MQFLHFLIFSLYFIDTPINAYPYNNPNTYPYVYSYNYYSFAVQSWCDIESYYIHGLWAQYNTTDYPSWCNGSKYQQIEGNLLLEMNKSWNASCPYSNGSQELWEHEWNKHGTCVQLQTNMTQNTYFQKAIDIYNSLINTGWSCGQTSNCIVACYDLDWNFIECP